MTDRRMGPRESAVIDRLHRLSVALPAMATEAAVARREAARLRLDNARLARRVEELQSALAVDASAPKRSDAF